jgi:short-subunit dehydrogenase
VDYAKRVAIVTGASSGIGRQLALDFADRRAKLALVARRGDRLGEVAAECRRRGTEVEALVGDLADPGFATSVVEATLTRLGRLDILVNNAGVPKHKHVYDVTPDDVEHTVRVNFLAPAYLILAALAPMLRQGEGTIVNISSAAGRIPPPREAVYAASKYALTGFSEGLALDLAGSNIHPAVVHVGPIDTEIWEKAEAPVRYRGKKHHPRIVSQAVFACIEKRRYEVTVPGSLRWAYLLKLIAPGLFRKGSARWDPVPSDVIERARQMARSRPTQ